MWAPVCREAGEEQRKIVSWGLGPAPLQIDKLDQKDVVDALNTLIAPVCMCLRRTRAREEVNCLPARCFVQVPQRCKGDEGAHAAGGRHPGVNDVGWCERCGAARGAHGNAWCSRYTSSAGNPTALSLSTPPPHFLTLVLPLGHPSPTTLLCMAASGLHAPCDHPPHKLPLVTDLSTALSLLLRAQTACLLASTHASPHLSTHLPPPFCPQGTVDHIHETLFAWQGPDSPLEGAASNPSRKSSGLRSFIK